MEERKRPIGISILAVLNIAFGILGAIYTVGLTIFGSPLAFRIVTAVFIFGLAIASGIGMWNGRKWGWYLGSFWYMYSIVRNAIALLLLIFVPPEELSNTGAHPPYYYFGRLIVFFLLYLYLFKGNVRDFFSLPEQKKWKPILAELGICIVIVTVIGIF